MIDWIQSNYWWLTLASIWASCFILYGKITLDGEEIMNELAYLREEVQEILEEGDEE
jgi:hypothetical protein